MENKKDPKNVKPCDVVKTSKGVQVSIYANAVKDSDVPLFKASIERRYVNKKNEWKSVRSFAEDELLVVAASALKAWNRMCELRKAAWQDAKSAEFEDAETEVSESTAEEEE